MRRFEEHGLIRTSIQLVMKRIKDAGMFSWRIHAFGVLSKAKCVGVGKESLVLRADSSWPGIQDLSIQQSCIRASSTRRQVAFFLLQMSANLWVSLTSYPTFLEALYCANVCAIRMRIFISLLAQRWIDTSIRWEKYADVGMD